MVLQHLRSGAELIRDSGTEARDIVRAVLEEDVDKAVRGAIHALNKHCVRFIDDEDGLVNGGVCLGNVSQWVLQGDAKWDLNRVVSLCLEVVDVAIRQRCLPTARRTENKGERFFVVDGVIKKNLARIRHLDGVD